MKNTICSLVKCSLTANVFSLLALSTTVSAQNSPLSSQLERAVKVDSSSYSFFTPMSDSNTELQHSASSLSAAQSERYIISFRDESAGQAALAKTDAAVIKTFSRSRAGKANSVGVMRKKTLTAARMTPQAAAALASNPAVEYIELDPIRRPMSPATSKAMPQLSQASIPYGIDMVQAPSLWGGADGAGTKVCIIDSGFYTGHEDLQSSNISGYPDNWAEDACGHGTHVGGTIAAFNNDFGVVGVLPSGVDLHIIKVFGGQSCQWTYASELVDALERCEAAGADIVSMSLGGIFESETEKAAFQDAYDNGVLSIAAAGNDGNTAYSYPASYDSVVSVAAIDANMAHADFSQRNDQVELAGPGVAVQSTLPFVDESSVIANGVSYQANHIDGSARTDGTVGNLVDGGYCSDSGNWSGQTVLCERGGISFYDKVMNVQSGGGVAVVFYNNVPGNFHGTLGGLFGEVNTSDIPAISLSQEEGHYLLANELGNNVTMTSTYEAPASGYAAYSGTSMATPHVSGVAALVWSQNTDLTNAQIRQALTASALDLGTAGWDDSYGYGLVQAQAAVEYLGGKPKALFSSNCPFLSCTFSDASSSINDSIVAWNWRFGDGGSSTEQSPSYTYVVPGTYTVTLTVTDDKGLSNSFSAEVIVGTDPRLTVRVVSSSVGLNTVTLMWTRASSSYIDIYLNGSLYRTVPNAGHITYGFRSGAYEFQVCEAGTSVCSNKVLTSF